MARDYWFIWKLFLGIRSYSPHLEQWEKFFFYANLACYQFHTVHGQALREHKRRRGKKGLILELAHLRMTLFVYYIPCYNITILCVVKSKINILMVDNSSSNFSHLWKISSSDQSHVLRVRTLDLFLAVCLRSWVH